MQSINDPFEGVDFSDLPKTSNFLARDGTQLAFRYYPATEVAAKGSVVLVHGSSASSSSMHVMAKGFAAAGYDTVRCSAAVPGLHVTKRLSRRAAGKDGIFPASEN